MTGTRSVRTRLVPVARIVAVLLLGVLVATAGVLWWQSLRPGAYAVTGGHGEHGAAGEGTVSVTSLVTDEGRDADVVFELVARRETVRIAGGRAFTGYTLNGSTPGPTIRATEGQLIEVHLRNDNIPEGITLHWHGLDVPAAMDGVAGVTQDAVPDGGTFVYRFVAGQVGTFWYHSHQVSHQQVIAGLFGALIVDPATGPDVAVHDVIATVHTYPDGIRSIGDAGAELRAPAAPGERVRVRVVNTDNAPISVWASQPYWVAAVDGTDLNEPSPVQDERVLVTAGGRVDVELRMPDRGGARVHVPGGSVILGDAPPPAPQPQRELDLLSYGEPAAVALDAAHPDREFRYEIGRMPGFLDGRPGLWWTVNGKTGADAPMFPVAQGDVVRMRISNASGEVHPMHLHGHHMLVLSRGGVPASGSPWWVDSLNVAHGETYEVAFLADNPGIWMDHCHNLPHAAEGLLAHVMYEGVHTPFLLGHETGNVPE